MLLVLSGGGVGEREAAALAHFNARLPPRARVLSLPWARPDPADPRVHAWVETRLPSVREVVTETSISAAATSRLDAFDALFICGGNTYRLLQHLRATGFAAALTAFARAGQPCYGGSAGAIVLGAHIGTCAHMDANELGLTQLDGLDLCGGRAVWCHHTPSDRERIEAFIAHTGREVISLPDDAAVQIDAHALEVIGAGDAQLWDAKSRAPRALRRTAADETPRR